MKIGNNNNVGITGEFYVLAQLTQRGFVATLTFGNTKKIDILVANEKINKIFKVEVKTSNRKLGRDLLFSKDPIYKWAMQDKHETIIDNNLIYCFVQINSDDSLPEFFLVPSKDVAQYVKWQHKFWMKSRNGNDSPMRNFRIEQSDPKKYRNNWRIFNK
jgi:hypothetical protein